MHSIIMLPASMQLLSGPSQLLVCFHQKALRRCAHSSTAGRELGQASGCGYAVRLRVSISWGVIPDGGESAAYLGAAKERNQPIIAALPAACCCRGP